MTSQQSSVDPVVRVLENIEDHLCVAFVLPHRVHGDFCGFVIWKMELSRGNAAERHAFYAVFLRQFQTGTIAGGKQLPVTSRYTTVYDWADGMENIIAGQIVGGRELCLSSRFLVPLLLHKFLAGQPKLYPRKGMNGVPYP